MNILNIWFNNFCTVNIEVLIVIVSLESWKYLISDIGIIQNRTRIVSNTEDINIVNSECLIIYDVLNGKFSVESKFFICSTICGTGYIRDNNNIIVLKIVCLIRSDRN